MITCFVYDGVIKGQFVYYPVYMKLSKVVSKNKIQWGSSPQADCDTPI